MKTTKVILWTARILCILAILFISLFALDSFSPERTFLQNAAAFGIHMIPSMILIALLIIAWKYEKAGGIILIVFSLLSATGIYLLNFNRSHSIKTSLMSALIISLPLTITGALFVISYYRAKKDSTVK